MGSIWLGFGEIDLIYRSNLAKIAEMDKIGLKNRSKLAQLSQMGSIWLGFGEIDLIYRSNLTKIAEMDKIDLKNRSKLAQRLQMGSIRLGFGDIDKVNERSEEYPKREDRSGEMKGST
jgi:hypothetical protein